MRKKSSTRILPLFFAGRSHLSEYLSLLAYCLFKDKTKLRWDMSQCHLIQGQEKVGNKTLVKKMKCFKSDFKA